MDVVIDDWSLVVAGRWNQWTFTPAWLGEHGLWSPLFQSETVVEHGHAVNHFVMEDIVLVPHHDRLVVIPRAATDSALLHAEGLVGTLLSLLPHTPATALGANFGFGGPSPLPDRLAEVVRLEDGPGLEGLGLAWHRTEISRGMAYRDGILNHLIGVSAEGWGIRLNFHNPVQNAQHARGLLDGYIVRCRDDAIELLRSLYGLTCSLGDPEAN